MTVTWFSPESCCVSSRPTLPIPLVAKKLGIPHTIARVRNPEYEKQLRFMREELGLSMAINPEKAAAREIARVLRFPTAMKVESFSKGRLELVERRSGRCPPPGEVRCQCRRLQSAGPGAAAPPYGCTAARSGR